MKTLLKILTLPIWLPFKLLWLASKVVVFCSLVVILALIVYFALHFLR
jgi:hypothetical protein